tara:strand:+ start:23993 stop:25018 length:1026 start_codon:yes stop_codon:yes gene_type:complete
MSNSKSNCVICLENSKIYVSCPHCEEGNYCKECIRKLVDENKYENCSICRREDWYKDEVKIQGIIKKKVEQDKINNLSDMLEENESNHYEILSVENIIKSIITILFICASTLMGKLIIFDICNYKISSNTDYEDLYKFIISLSTGIGIFIILYITKLCSLQLHNFCKEKEWFNCFHLGILIVLLGLTSLLGYFIMFELFELENNFAENTTGNDIITIFISFLTGLLVYLIIFIMILINKLILGDDWYECCCNPMIMLPIILLLLLGTYLGRIIIDGTGLTLNEDEKNKDKINFAISFLIGNSLIIGPVIILAICSKCIYKIREFREACIYQDNNVNGDEMI